MNTTVRAAASAVLGMAGTCFFQVSNAQVATEATGTNALELETVIVTARPDSLTEGIHFSRITQSVSSNLTDFAGLNVADVANALRAQILGDTGAIATVDLTLTPSTGNPTSATPAIRIACMVRL